jgi:hypothetical protein
MLVRHLSFDFWPHFELFVTENASGGNTLGMELWVQQRNNWQQNTGSQWDSISKLVRIHSFRFMVFSRAQPK